MFISQGINANACHLSMSDAMLLKVYLWLKILKVDTVRSVPPLVDGIPVDFSLQEPLAVTEEGQTRNALALFGTISVKKRFV